MTSKTASSWKYWQLVAVPKCTQVLMWAQWYNQSFTLHKTLWASWKPTEQNRQNMSTLERPFMEGKINTSQLLELLGPDPPISSSSRHFKHAMARFFQILIKWRPCLICTFLFVWQPTFQSEFIFNSLSKVRPKQLFKLTKFSILAFLRHWTSQIHLI